jgi:transposase
MNNDMERLELFRTLRAEIRGSSRHLVVGIDVGKQTHHAFYGTARGETLRKRFAFANTRRDFERLRGLAADLSIRHELTQTVYGLEPTGVYHKPLLEYLMGCAEHVVLVSNVAVQRNRELLDGRWDKSDVNDPANVADLVGQGRCLFAEFPRGELRDLRSMLSLRARLRKLEHSYRMRIRNHLVAQYFPELDRGYTQGGGDQMVLRVAEQCFDPREIAGLDFDTFWNRIALPNWGQRQEPRLRSVWEGAQESVGCRVPESVLWQARQTVQSLAALRADLQHTQHLMGQYAQRLPGYPSVISIPGVGPAVAAAILAAIGDPLRFDHPRQVLRLAGLDLCASRSGKNSERVVPRISKQGKAPLRYALVQAARIAAHSDETIRAYYSHQLEGRQQERGIRLKRTVKLAAKLLVVAWTLMRRGETFDPDRFCH